MNLNLKQTIIAVLTFGGGTALLCLLTFIHINQGNVSIPLGTVVDALLNPQDTIKHHTVRILRLPRAVMGILAGGALAVSGVILQTVTKNPLSSASTLGIHSGTYFAVVLTTIFFPFIMFANGIVTAFLGGILTFAAVYLLSGAGNATPVRMVLAGMIVTFLFSSLTSVLQIFYENETQGLFLWGSGTLIQNNWDGVQFSLPLIAAGMLTAFIFSKKMDTLTLGDDVATALGQNVRIVKLITILAAVLLTSVTVSVVGPIGFVGLVAPHIIKLIGYRSHIPLVIGSFLWGGNVLLLADILARIIDPSFSELPVGAITALIGSPWLIWLVMRMKQSQGSGDTGTIMAGSGEVNLSLKKLLPLLGAVIVLTILVSMSSGNYGFEPLVAWDAFFGASNEFIRNFILNLRLPRALVAVFSGAILAVSGLIFQGVLRNPLADPSVIGITSGAGVGALMTMYVFSVSAVWIPVGAMIGAFVFFLIVMGLGAKAEFQPTILALLGIGVSAFGSAIIQILVVQADLGVASALTWLSGTTYAKGWSQLLQYLLWPVILFIPLLVFYIKTLDVLSLGDDTAKGLGLRVRSVRFQMAMIATLLAACSVAAVGSIGFVGLIAPHVARLLVGSANQKLLPVTMLLGGLLLLVADLFSRTLLAPNEIPSGILVALIGAPYFLWLMKKRAA
ncbi:iron ABC transporter permease [Halobacillus halophilus]|uniref:ABC-type transport system permease protein (Probable substrate iron complex) n=1 Tax=Halobacillus halophilus (strain ATCC 35676 / DSM 2266 / JCM 20832 / KCTC 3685 / LMG 17431 / NBRC 102448 / NCIMB 2269) TaxID=866895 RepID=I0JLA5_HALH3|nr:iron ABC transporter permease [Halobacillus halophilus]ASF41468.1 iron ABC transporter permease [Halobacillus halophilus]CCG44925.1 ABC-type transport system permease protein (probable substrate iron complex) [Halobacillus halophilus DSM 2266]